MAAIGLVAAIGLAGCSGSESSGSAGGGDVTVEAPAPGQVSLVDAPAFDAAIETDGVVVIDVRTPGEFADGHIDSAVNIDLQNPAFAQQILDLDPDVTYAVYCRSGNRSATATQYMVDNGFTSLYELDGGIVAWESAGLPLV